MLNFLMIALGGLCLVPFSYMNLSFPVHLVVYSIAGLLFGIYGVRESIRNPSPRSGEARWGIDRIFLKKEVPIHTPPNLPLPTARGGIVFPVSFLLSIVFLAFLVLSSLLSEGGMRGGLKASAGVLFRGILPAFAVWALVRFRGKEKNLHRFLSVLGGLVAFSALFEIATGRYFIFERIPLDPIRTHFSPEYGVAAGAFGQPLVLGSVLCLFLPISLAEWKEKRSILNAVVVLLIFSAVLLTYRRSAYFLSLVTLVWFGFRFFRPRRMIVGLCALAGFVVLLNLLFPRVRQRTLSRLSVAQIATEIKSSHRTQSYRTVWRMLSEKPLIGFGTRQFEDVHKRFATHKIAYETPDNQYLRILAENGLIGFFAFLSLLGFVLMKAVRNRGSPHGWARLSAFVNFMLAMVVLDALYWPALQMMSFILMGLIDGINQT